MELDPDLNWKDIYDTGFNSHNGPIRYARVEDGWICALELDKRHVNFGGVAHGGVMMWLADVCMGVGAHKSADDAFCSTIELDIHLMAAAKIGQTLICKSRLNRAVSGVFFMECELWAGGRQVARASGIWKLLNRPKAA